MKKIFPFEDKVLNNLKYLEFYEKLHFKTNRFKDSSIELMVGFPNIVSEKE